MNFETKIIDRQGAQLSQECRHLSTTSQGEQTAVRQNVIWIWPLVPIGPGVRRQCRHPAKSFHVQAEKSTAHIDSRQHS